MKEHLQASYGCSVELALDVIGGKWKAVILANLKDGPLRYGALRSRAPTMSDKMLTQRLGELVELELVARRQDGRSVSYQLTEQGAGLRPVLEALHRWGADLARKHGVRLDYEG